MGANDDYLPQNDASLQLGEIWHNNELKGEKWSPCASTDKASDSTDRQNEQIGLGNNVQLKMRNRSSEENTREGNWYNCLVVVCQWWRARKWANADTRCNSVVSRCRLGKPDVMQTGNKSSDKCGAEWYSKSTRQHCDSFNMNVSIFGYQKWHVH